MPSYNKDWIKQRKIVHMGGTKLSPEVVLARTLEKAKAGHVKGVVVIIQWDDETMSPDWSQLKLSELALAGVVMNELVRQNVLKDAED